MNIQLSHQFGPVGINGFGADRQVSSDFLVAGTRGQQMQNLPLAPCEFGARAGFAQNLCNGIGVNGFPSQHHFESSQQLFWWAGFKEQPVHAGTHPICDLTLRCKAGDNDNLSGLAPAPNFIKHLHPARQRHTTIEQQQGRLQVFGETDGLKTIAGLGHYFGPVLANGQLVANRAQPGSHEGMIVCDHYGKG